MVTKNKSDVPKPTLLLFGAAAGGTFTLPAVPYSLMHGRRPTPKQTKQQKKTTLCRLLEYIANERTRERSLFSSLDENNYDAVCQLVARSLLAHCQRER